MEVSNQVHDLVPTEWEAGWILELVWTSSRKEKCLLLLLEIETQIEHILI
jgi:hypothetical protein